MCQRARKDLKMSLEDKFNSVVVLLEEHNKAIGGPGNPGFVDVNGFISTLKATGATTEERLKSLRYEDILDYLPSTNNIKPLLLAKAIAGIFRGKDELIQTQTQGQAQPYQVSAKKADKMSPRQLVDNFDPSYPHNAVGKTLAIMSNGEAFIVFETGRIVDRDSTFKCLMEVKDGYPGREDITVSGAIKPVYKLGELPDNFVDENPLYKNRPLRPDGTCDQTGRSWDGVLFEVRQLVRIGVDLGEIEVKIDNAHNVLDLAVSPDAMTKLRNRYRKSSMKFDSLALTGNLPKLKIALGNVKQLSSRGKNPFDNGAKVLFRN